MPYKLVIFDFDGTLADSFPFFVEVHNQLAQKHGFKPVARTEIPELRQYGARQIMRHVGLPKWKMPFVARSFVRLMRQNAQAIAPFAEVEETLAHLAASGIMLALVTANSAENVRAILGPGLASLFVVQETGVSIFGKRRRLGHVLKRSGVAAHQAIYVGDQSTDAEAAAGVGIAFGAVAWGYAPLSSLQAYGPAEIFDHVAALRGLACSERCAAA